MARRVSVPVKKLEERVKDFGEIVTGYPLQLAVAEASRCLICYDAPCIKGCPAKIDIPIFIRRIKTKDIRGSINVIRQNNVLPGICARVCPVEKLCEKYCCSKELTEPINIGALQRFAADFEKERGIKPSRLEITGKKVAVVGSGPAGLAAAFELIRMGHGVTIFEAKSLLGGMLVYGIPPYRLPKEAVRAEIDYIERAGITINTNKPVKKIDELFDEGFDAVFIGIGTTQSVFLNLPDENLEGVYLGMEFLKKINEVEVGKQEPFSLLGKKVAVIGGGNVAIDASRCCSRLGAEKVYVVYRRSLEEMPAYKSEVAAARHEGIEFMILSTPTKILGNENVVGLECIRMKLGEADESGRRKPIPIPGSEFKFDVDLVIEAIGQKVDEKFIKDNPHVKVSNGLIVVDKETGMTSCQGVFAGGDVINGGTTVVQAVAEGTLAAKGIDKYLKGGN